MAPNKRQPFAIFDGHALFIVRVPHGVPLETNGVVMGEFSPAICDDYLSMQIDRAIRPKTASIKRKNLRR